MGPADLERHNPNYVGGDINGGAQDLPAVLHAAGAAARALFDAGPRPLHLLVVDAARRRRARHVRLSRGAGGAATLALEH